jgi:large subunit ribosomal protein L13
MKTSFPKPGPSQWYVLDASDQVLGRLASRIAQVIRGRHKPSFVPHLLCGDHVIVTSAEKIKVTGAKMEQKKYYRHAGWLGHLRTTTMKQQMQKDPTEILIHAVKGMLPKNLSRDHILKKLHVYVGTTHTHDAQKPLSFPL